MDNLKSGDAGGKKTLVEEGTSFKGSLSSTCPVVVKGRVEGDVSAPSLQVSASGAVHGKVKVGEMQSHGELSGEFDAETVQLSGSVKDNTIVRARSLEVKLAPTNGKLQVVFGECTLDVGEAPSKEAAINPPKNQPEKAVAVAKANGTSVPPPAMEALHRNGSVPPPARVEDPGNKEAMQAVGAESMSEASEPGRKHKR
ncbi:MAG TPA: polymer-forming cytoskeletal protein [Polyangiaceae bacterium]|nr:polymer-forming cytoskeletal protein [Polyangiaceae bacterium]